MGGVFAVIQTGTIAAVGVVSKLRLIYFLFSDKYFV
jgi:hypothetical protein